MTRQIILFDGVCNLCSGSVRFIIKRDPKQQFKFASLQSEFGSSTLLKLGLDPNELHSIILLVDDNVYQRSDAALRITRQLTGLWPLFYGFIILPRFLRDWVYNMIAKNRYKLFGRKDECWLPSPQLASRFIS